MVECDSMHFSHDISRRWQHPKAKHATKIRAVCRAFQIFLSLIPGHKKIISGFSGREKNSVRISRTKKVEMPLFSGFPGRTVLESAFPGFFGCFFSGCGGRGLRLIKTQLQTSEGGQLCIGGKEDQQSAGRKVEQRAVCALGGGFYAGGGALKGASCPNHLNAQG